jgi:hypothetical protein
VPNPADPQSLNRYSYCLNNPFKYIDPSGHWVDLLFEIAGIGFDIQQLVSEPSWGNAGFLALDVALAFVPFVPGVVGITTKGGAQAVKTINRIDDAADGLKAINKATNMPEKRVIGHYSDDYIGKAKKLDAKYFDVSNDLDPTVIEKMNFEWLDEGIKNGDEFILATPYDSVRSPSALRKEIDYLLEHDYIYVINKGEEILMPSENLMNLINYVDYFCY